MKGQANKRTIGTVLLTIWVSSSQAQTPTDSTVTLGEVMVKAHTMIRRLDRTLFLPTREAKRSAYNPYDLMCSMTMPHVQVDPLAKTVSANSGAVQLRINGIKAAQTEVAALLPKDIVRIELIENPGKRYGDEQLGAVIDIIVRNRDAGGLINIQTTNSPIVAFGENTLSAKYNQGHAQWGVSYSNNYRGLHHQHTDKTEDFVLGNTTIHRVQQGQDDRSDWNDHTVDLSYNYILPDRYTFNAVLRSYSKQAPHQDETSLINDRITAHTALQAHNWSPSLDLYFQRTLPHQQTLSLNLTGTLINADRNRRYTETITQVKPLADIVTNTEGRKRSIIAEAIYDKQFTTIALSAGLRHYQMHDRDEYTGASPVVSEMDQSRSSFFAEILGRWKMLNYGFSAGATRSWFSENGKHQTYFIFTPTVRLAIAPHKNGYLNYRFSTDPQLPSLSATTDVEQALDTIQLVRGNPLLKTYCVYSHSLNYSLHAGKFLAMLTTTYACHHHPIMEQLLAEDNRIVLMQDNQKSYQVLDIAPMIAFNALDLFSLKNVLTMSLEVGFNRYWSRGNTYRHYFNNFYYNAVFSLSYKELGLMGQLRKNRDYLLGETIYKGENMTVLMAVWNHARLQLGAGILFPFVNNFRSGKERLSAIAPCQSWTYAKESGNLFLLRLNYNLEFGKAYHTQRKRTNNRDTEDGMLGL